MPEDLHRLAARLREAGTEGQGLRRALLDKIGEAAQPLADEIGSTAHLDPYMPDRYAAVLAKDLNVTVRRTIGAELKVTIRAQAREHKRKVGLLEAGFINHPVFAQGLRKTWNWENGQTKGMRSRFFADAVEKHVPDIRDKGAEALRETNRKLAGG